MATLDRSQNSAAIRLRAVGLGLNGAMIGLWLALYRPVLDYLGIIFSREDFRTNQLLLLGVVGLIAIHLRRSAGRPRLDAPAQLYRPALALALGGSALYLAAERWLDINTLSAGLFGLASYGLLGLWLSPGRWRSGLPAALLLVGTLPFGEHMQTFIGYPLRLLTAALVRDGLAAAGVASVGIDTILVLENGVSQVDLPCSGVKSLWTGALFLLAATWIERRPLNPGWFLTAALLAGLLVAVNLARVGLLVVIGQVAGWPIAAEMLHVPLGVLGFIAACAAAIALLHFHPSQRQLGQGGAEQTPPCRGAEGPDCENVGTLPIIQNSKFTLSKRQNSKFIILTLLAMLLLYSPRPQTGLDRPAPDWGWPAGLVTEPLPLKPEEVAWFTRDGAEAAERRRFEWRGLTGSMILISSSTWRANHRPERCFEVYGLSLDDSRTDLVAPDFPVRLVSLGSRQGRSQQAVYWFQAAGRTTDDYGARIWADLAPGRERWVLVSILFDGTPDPGSPEVRALYLALHDSIARSLEGGFIDE